MGDAYGGATNKLKKVSPSSRKIFIKNIKHQMFPFLSSYVYYICENASASQLLKLYKTCKFFYIYTRGLIIIDDFEICASKDKERIVGNSMAIWIDNPAWSKLNNLWICKSFTYYENYDESDKLLELDHQKFSRLTYKCLSINGALSVADFEFLIKPTTIRQLFVCDDTAFPEPRLSFEEMIERAPHVSAFYMFHVFHDDDQNPQPIDMDKLIALERQTKLQSLELFGVSKIPDAKRVVEFFKKHATPDIDFFFGFDKEDDEYDLDNVKTFYKTVNAELRAWKTLQLPPTVSSSFIDLAGKTAVITACDSIGRETAILFRKLGASVAVLSRNGMELNSLIEECQSIENDGSLHTFGFSFGVEFPIEFKSFNYKCGSKIDILINYCDIFGFEGVPDIKSEEEFQTERFVIGIRSNLTDWAKPYLTEAKGTMINVTNPHDLIVDPKEAAFIANCELKIKNNEAELLAAGVRINNVDSGAPVTTLLRPEGISDFEFKKLLERTQKTHEQQIANAIAFLASDSAKLINGATLPVNAATNLQ